MKPPAEVQDEVRRYLASRNPHVAALVSRVDRGAINCHGEVNGLEVEPEPGDYGPLKFEPERA